MEFEWDEGKRAQVIADRALDFVFARRFFDGRPAIHIPSPRDGEERVKTIAMFDDVVLTLIWCWRGDVIRIISMRRAHEKEIRAYRQVHGR
jgi:uncharacterized protein